MKKLSSFPNYRTSAISILIFMSLDLGTARAETVAMVPIAEPVIARRDQLLETENKSAGTLIGAVKPAYDVMDFTTPTAQTIDELIQLAAQADVLKPAYTVDRFSPKAIAQAKKPAPPKPEDDDAEELEDVKVTTDRTRSKESTETSPAFTVTQEAITASGATTVSGVLVKLLPSFSAAESLGGINTDQGVFLRGLGSNRFSVLIDGRPTTRPSNNRSADLGRLGVSNIERIEVFTGPAGLRYGAGAIAGTINIITRLPDKERLTISAEGGSYGFSRETVNYTNTNGLKIGTAGYIGYELNYERRSALNNYTGIAVEQPSGSGIRFPEGAGSLPPGVLPPNAPTLIFDQNQELAGGTFYQTPISYQKITRGAYVFSDNYAAKIIYQPAIDHILRASVSVSSVRSGDQFADLNQLANCRKVPRGNNVSVEIDPNPLIDPSNLAFYEYTECNISTRNPNSLGADVRGRGDQAEDNITGNLGWEWALTKENKLTFLSSFSASFETNPSSPGTRTASSQIVDAQFNYSSELSKNNTFNAGVEYFQQRFNATPLPGAGGNQFFPSAFANTGGTGFFAVDITKRSLAFYATDQWRLFDDALVIDLGIRSTTDQFFGTYTTPGAGLRWNFGGPKGQEPLAFRASWFQGFRAPGLADIFGYTGFNGTQARDPNIGSANVLRNLALKPETSVSFDIGFDFKISPTSLFRVTYFRNDLNNGIVGNVTIRPLPKQILTPKGFVDAYTPEQLAGLRFPSQCDPSSRDSIPGTFAGANSSPIINGQDTCLVPFTTTLNSQSYLSTGWEFSYRWQIIPQLELNASYSFIDSRPTGDPFSNFITDTDTGIDVPLGSGGVNGGFFYGYQPVDIPFTTGNFGLRYNSNRYRVALSTSFVGLRPRGTAGNNYYQPYSRWDLTFGIPLTEELTFTGGAYNIFGDRSVIGDSGIGIGAGVLQPPPTYRFGIEATLGSK